MISHQDQLMGKQDLLMTGTMLAEERLTTKISLALCWEKQERL